MQSKLSLREAIKERLQRMKDYEKRVESKHIAQTIEKIMEAEKHDGIVAIFIPYTDEPNILPIIEKALEKKWRLCMPAIDGTHLRMCAIETLEGIARNPYTRIFEPAIKKWIPEEEITLVIVPGRAFTMTGDRLGRGNGGYDYWISAQRKRSSATKMVGVCFDCQIVQSIMMELHDETVDRVISATHDTQWISAR